MNINSINASQTNYTQVNSASTSTSLSSDQKSYITDLLSQYDANSLSKSDAKEIVKALQDANISPSEALASTMSASGFDAKNIGDLAGVGQNAKGQRPMGPPPPRTEEMSSISDLLDSLLNSEDSDTTSSTTTTFSSFDTILDYTSKIVSLKDSSKTEVMELLKQYNSEDNTLSQEDTQKFIVNSLSQILKETDNYNRMSFYA